MDAPGCSARARATLTARRARRLSPSGAWAKLCWAQSAHSEQDRRKVSMRVSSATEAAGAGGSNPSRTVPSAIPYIMPTYQLILCRLAAIVLTPILGNDKPGRPDNQASKYCQSDYDYEHGHEHEHEKFRVDGRALPSIKRMLSKGTAIRQD